MYRSTSKLVPRFCITCLNKYWCIKSLNTFFLWSSSVSKWQFMIYNSTPSSIRPRKYDSVLITWRALWWPFPFLCGISAASCAFDSNDLTAICYNTSLAKPATRTSRTPLLNNGIANFVLLLHFSRESCRLFVFCLSVLPVRSNNFRGKQLHWPFSFQLMSFVVCCVAIMLPLLKSPSHRSVLLQYFYCM